MWTHLALVLGDADLALGGLTSAVGAGNGRGTPWGCTLNNGVVGDLGVRVAEGNVDH